MQVLTGTRVAEVGEDQVVLHDGRTLRARTLVWTGGVRVNERLSTWGFTTGAGGRVMVTPYLESVDHPTPSSSATPA